MSNPLKTERYVEQLIASLRAEVIAGAETSNLSPVLKEGFRILNAKISAAADELERLSTELTARAEHLQKLCEQIEKCAPVDDHGHPMTMNGAYIAACNLLKGDAT